MARRKQTIIQRDMSIGEVREDFLERGDAELRAVSVKGVSNMRPLSSGALEARPGLKYINQTWGDDLRILDEISDSDGNEYLFGIQGNFVVILNEDGTAAYNEPTVGVSVSNQQPLGDAWITKINDRIFVGDEDAFYSFDFTGPSTSPPFLSRSYFKTAGNRSLQPFWVFNEGVTLQPSALTGTITVTASSGVFPAGYRATFETVYIRYAGKQIRMDTRVSDTEWNATVMEELPPSFRLTVSDESEIQVGDVVVGQDTNYQGQVVAIGSGTIDVVTISFYPGPDVSEKLASPRSTFTVSAKSSISPLATTFWDEQLMGEYRGYPRAGSNAGGRLVLTDFPGVPGVVAVSSARDPRDFDVGLGDDDAIVRQVGGSRIRHAMNAGDLLLFSDQGSYVQELRGGNPLTPSNFNPVLLDRRGCNGVRPVLVGDGVIFIGSDNNTIFAALLDGNVFLKWSVIPLTDLHSQLINSPTQLCAPSLNSPDTEKYLIAVNADGTLAVIFYSQSLQGDQVGIFPWSTEGQFKTVVGAFGTYYAAVDRVLTSGTVRMLEKFEDGIFVDSAAEPASSPSTNHLRGKTVTIMDDRVVHGEYVVASDGSIADEPADPSNRQIGLDFTPSVSPWAVQVIQSARFGTFDARCVRFLVSVQGTASFQVRCNSHTRVLGGYSFGDPLDVPPQLLTRRYVIPVFGRRQNADLEVIRQQPGPFRILYLGQEVQS